MTGILNPELVADLRMVLDNFGRHSITSDMTIAAERLNRALFPATEPAEAPCTICNVNEANHAGVSYYHPFTTELGPFDDDGNDRPAAAEPATAVRDGSDLVVVQRSHTAKAVQSWMTLDLWTDLRKNDKDFDAEYERQGFGDLWATLLGEVRALVQATTPAPAEPAEEETKAEGAVGTVCDETQKAYDEAVSLSYWLAKQLGEHVDDAYDRGETLTDTVQRLVASSLGSSTEGERKSPELWYIEAQDRPNAGNSSAYVDTEARANYYAKLFQDTGYLNVAIYPPVVPAPTETEWQTWRAVPDGVSYRSSRPGSPLTFTNRDGVRFVNNTGMPDEFERLQPFCAVKEPS